MERVDGYMKRAEDLKNVLEGLNSQAKGGKQRLAFKETFWFFVTWYEIEEIRCHCLDEKKIDFWY